MVPSEPSNRAIDSDRFDSATSLNEADDLALNEYSFPLLRRPWPAVLGVILLILIAFFGWRWWQGSQTAGPGGAGPGAAQGQAAPVALDTVETATVQDATEFVGTLESRNSVSLGPEIDGRISQILVEPGQTVTAGQPLIQLRPDQRQAEYASVLASVNSARAIRANAASELQALQAERASNVADVELQEENYRRISALVQEGALPEQDLDQIERDRNTALAALRAIDQRIAASRASLAEAESALQQAQANAAASNAQLQDTVVRAPFSGTIGDIPVKLGDYVSAGDTVTSVTQNEVLELEMSVPLERGSDLSTGQRVELLNSQGEVLTVGRINFTAPQVNTAAQSILVKANFDNPNGRLLAGQFVRARLIWDEQTGILIPTTAVSRLGGQAFVFVAEEPPSQDGQPQSEQPPNGQPQLIASQRLVQLGDIQGNSYHVLEGLEPGEQIVTSGILNLSDGVPISPMPANPQAQPPNQGSGNG